jgi:flagellar hook-associated protein 3 FlgL
MATTRVASNAGMDRVYSDLTRTFNRMAKTQGQISSTKKLQKPSDSPTDVAVALKERSNQRRLEQYAANATDATGFLRVSDDALMGVQDAALQARVQMATAISGAIDGTGREAVAQAIGGLRDGMLQLANTTYNGRSVFAGTAASNQPAYANTGVYNGDAGSVRRAIDDGLTLDVNVTGPTVFGAHDATTPLSGDMFQIMDAMAAAVRSGDVAAMQVAGASFDAAVARVSTAQIRIGSVSNQVETTISRNSQMTIDVKERLSKVEDTDLAEAILSMRSDEAAYQAALGVTAKVIQPTLMDFLR